MKAFWGLWSEYNYFMLVLSPCFKQSSCVIKITCCHQQYDVLGSIEGDMCCAKLFLHSTAFTAKVDNGCMIGQHVAFHHAFLSLKLLELLLCSSRSKSSRTHLLLVIPMARVHHINDVCSVCVCVFPTNLCLGEFGFQISYHQICGIVLSDGIKLS